MDLLLFLPTFNVNFLVLIFMPSSNAETTRSSATLVNRCLNRREWLVHLLPEPESMSVFQSYSGKCRFNVHAHHHIEEHAYTLKTFIIVFYTILIFHRIKTLMKPKRTNCKNKQKTKMWIFMLSSIRLASSRCLFFKIPW